LKKLDILKVSAWMAIVGGVLLPLAESIRRINQLLDPLLFFTWFDDYILGFILVYTAYRVISKKINAPIYLLAAWGVAVGGLANSLNTTINLNKITPIENGIFSSSIIIFGKSTLLIYMLLGLILCIKGNEEK